MSVPHRPTVARFTRRRASGYTGRVRAFSSWLLVAIAMSGCSHTAPPGAAARTVEPTVLLRRAGGPELRVVVELAQTEPERTRGLMYRQTLDPGHGMLFLFEQPQPLKFWMKNTYIPLDMIFIGTDKKIVFIEENATPLTLEPRGPDSNTQYVLEVPGGWCKQRGIGLGLEVVFEHLP